MNNKPRHDFYRQVEDAEMLHRLIKAYVWIAIYFVVLIFLPFALLTMIYVVTTYAGGSSKLVIDAIKGLAG